MLGAVATTPYDKHYYIYRQQELAEWVYLNGFQSAAPSKHDLNIVALYLRQVKGMSPSQIRQEITRFCEQYLPGYSFRRDCMLINDAVNYAVNPKHHLSQVDQVVVFKDEIEFIQSLNEDWLRNVLREANEDNPGSDTYINLSRAAENIRRTVLAIMIHKKIDAAIFESKPKNIEMGKEYSFFMYSHDSTRFTSLPRVAGLKRFKGFKFARDVIRPMWLGGLVEFVAMRGDPLRLDFGTKIHKSSYKDGHEDEVAFVARDYEHIGWYYDAFVAGQTGKIGFCAKPGCMMPYLTKGHGNAKRYCAYHALGTIRANSNVLVNCIVCGKEFKRNALAAKQVRCPECQAAYKIEYAKERRAPRPSTDS